MPQLTTKREISAITVFENCLEMLVRSPNLMACAELHLWLGLRGAGSFQGSDRASSQGAERVLVGCDSSIVEHQNGGQDCGLNLATGGYPKSTAQMSV